MTINTQPQERPIPCSEWKGPLQVGKPHLQEQSRLFQLPAEIRGLIFEHVFSSSLIHVESLGVRLAHVTCRDWTTSGAEDDHSHCHRGRKEGTVTMSNPEDPNDQMTTLILTCRLT